VDPNRRDVSSSVLSVPAPRLQEEPDQDRSHNYHRAAETWRDETGLTIDGGGVGDDYSAGDQEEAEKKPDVMARSGQFFSPERCESLLCMSDKVVCRDHEPERQQEIVVLAKRMDKRDYHQGKPDPEMMQPETRQRHHDS
jgi:hypothetical protein